MTDREKQLLDNSLDALDRLFDRHTSVFDVWMLFFATSEALRDSDHFHVFDSAVVTLLELVRSGLSQDEQRDRALDVTNDLRLYLADQI